MLLFYRVYISQQVNNCDRGVMAARIVDRLISICARDAFQQHSAALGCQTGWPTPQHDGSIARSIDEMRNVVVVRPQQTVNPCPYTIYCSNGQKTADYNCRRCASSKGNLDDKWAQECVATHTAAACDFNMYSCLRHFKYWVFAAHLRMLC